MPGSEDARRPVRGVHSDLTLPPVPVLFSCLPQLSFAKLLLRKSDADAMKTCKIVVDMLQQVASLCQ
jgi:hypothetical protein